MSDIQDVRIRLDGGQYSGYINNCKNIKGSRWSSDEHYRHITQGLGSVASNIINGWKNIITGTSIRESFSADFIPLKKFAAPSFSGHNDSIDGNHLIRPGDGIYGLDSVAKADYGIDGMKPTYQTADYAATEPNVHIPRVSFGTNDNDSSSSIRLSDGWTYGNRMNRYKHNYPSVTSLISDYELRTNNIYRKYEYKGVDQIILDGKTNKNVTVVFDADKENLDINVIVKFARKLPIGIRFNITIHYKGSKTANVDVDDYAWPKLIVCNEDSLLHPYEPGSNGMYNKMICYRDINGFSQGASDIIHGGDTNPYCAMYNMYPITDIKGVTGCIGRQPLFYDAMVTGLETKWGRINNNKFKNVVSYYIKVVNIEGGPFIYSVVMSCNGGEGMVK